MKKVSVVTAIMLCLAGAVAGAVITVAVSRVAGEMMSMTDKRNISEQQAKEIVYEKAGVLAGDVNTIKAEIETENGRLVYDIEFYHNNIKYSAEVSTEDGSIVSWETESR